MGTSAEFRKNVLGVSSRFMFERPIRCVGRADFTLHSSKDLDGGSDSEIYNGTFVSTHGFARLAYHHSTQTLCLIASKTPLNVRGVRDKTNNGIFATYEGLSRSYIIAAYRIRDDGKNDIEIGRHLRRALERYGIDLAERSEKHFRQFAASFTCPEPVHKKVDGLGSGEIFTNGSVSYLLTRVRNGYKATFNAAARREGGHFVPFEPHEKSKFSTRVASLSKTIYEGESYSAARAEIEKHSVKVFARLWDQKSLYADEGLMFKMKKFRADSINYLVDNKIPAVTTLILSSGMFAYNPTAGIGTAFGATLLHSLAHKLTDEGLHGAVSAIEKARQARARASILAYPMGQDASDHFKVQTAANILKLCPKLDLNRFSPQDFEFLTAEQSKMLLDHDEVEDGMQPENLRGHLLNAHLRGFRSTCMVLDDCTLIDDFRNGLIRLMHEKPDGGIIVYAQYRPEACTAEHMRLPQGYVDQFEGGIVRLEYDRKGKNFRESVSMQTNVSFNQMMNELQRVLLFRNKKPTSEAIREKSYRVVADMFYDSHAKNDFIDDVAHIIEEDSEVLTYHLPDIHSML